MWFHCIPSNMYLHSLQSFNILITVYIYKKKYMKVKFEEIRGTKIINLYNEN